MSLLLQDIDIRVNGVPHLEKVSLEFKRGGLYTILGRTLSGKTTLLRAISGFETPQKGTMVLHNKDFLHLPVWKRRIAMVYQQFINYPHFNVLENVIFPLLRAGTGRKKAQQRAREVLSRLELSEFAHRRPSSLSGGQQQRVALARALAKQAEILLLDEPLANLDYKLREQLREDFQNIFADQNEAIVIYTTTEPEEAIQLGHELIVMDKGAVIQQGKPLDVFNTPTTIRCAEIINNPPMNFFRGRVQEDEILLEGGARLSLPAHLADLPAGDYQFGLQASEILLGGEIGCHVTLCEISGSQTILHLRAEIGSMILNGPGVHDYSIGSLIQVTINSERLYAFSVSGDLIKAPAPLQVYDSGDNPWPRSNC